MADTIYGSVEFPTYSTAAQYLVEPDYYTTLAASGDLTGYSFDQSANCKKVYKTATVLGSTGWTWVVYSDNAETACQTFIYNTTTKEVVRLHYAVVSGAHYWWDYYSVLESFSSNGTESFFAALGITRNSSFSTSQALSSTVWSAYHDALVSELVSITGKYGWQDDSDLVDRVDTINSTLSYVGGSVSNSPVNELVSDFERAQDETKQANEDRYLQLTKDCESSAEPNPLIVMSYPELARHILVTYFDPLSAQLLQDQQDQEVDDQEDIDALLDDWTELDDQYNVLGEIARADAERKFSATLSDATQALLDAGLYNALSLAAVTSGVGAAEANELSRINDGLTERRIATQQAIYVARAGARRAQSADKLELRQKLAEWEAQKGRIMADLYRYAPLVVEGRTDTGPGLNDIANITMQIGRGAGATEMLRAFQSQQIIATQGHRLLEGPVAKEE